jgi:hypothetical protein
MEQNHIIPTIKKHDKKNTKWEDMQQKKAIRRKFSTTTT